MDQNRASRPSVSRETRLLLLTVLVAVAALWVLARLRFPERPATLNPVPPILTQLASPPSFEDLAGSVADVQSRLAPAFIVLGASGHSSSDRIAGPQVTALRLRDEVAVALVAQSELPAANMAGITILGRDAVTGLTVLRVPASAAPPLTIWTPRRPESPRYLIAVEPARGGIAVRPVFVGGLQATVSPTWLATLWAMPPLTDVGAGTFMSTVDGELAGVVIDHEGGPAVVPAGTLIAMADRLQRDPERTPGWLGVEVARLTGPIAAATGATRGVVVTWVAPQGPAAGRLEPTDIVETVDETAVLTPEHWLARTGRLSAGETIALRVRRRDQTQEVVLTAAPAPQPSETRSLGLTMRRVAQIGVEILRVEPGSAAARAGLMPGDVITIADAYRAPTAAQVGRAFVAATDDRPVVVGVTRGADHLVLALEAR